MSRSCRLLWLLAIPVDALQSQDAKDSSLFPLHIPAAWVAMHCRRDTTGSVPVRRSVTSFEFRLGREFTHERVIFASFDTAGKPLLLREMIMRSKSDLTVENRIVHVGADSRGELHGRTTTIRGSIAKQSASNGVPGVETTSTTEDMSAEEGRRAQVLFSWLWEHRCGRL